MPKKLDEFRRKYELFKRMLTDKLNDFSFQRLKEQLLILKEDYNEFSKSPLVARNHLIKHLQSAASTAESKLVRLKPTQWDLNDNFVQIKFEPLEEVKEEPIDQEEVSCQPTTSSNLQVKEKRELSGHQRLSLNSRIRKSLKRKSTLKGFLGGKSSTQIQQKFISLLKAKKLAKFKPIKETIKSEQLVSKESQTEVETEFSLNDVAFSVVPSAVAEMPPKESSLVTKQ
jgi:hypothetical protein